MTVLSPASSLPASASATSRARPQALALWLFGVTGMIFLMALIGAITRLTESGLSMVEWRPLIGTVPPMTDAEWQRVFDLYRETPEYRLKNAGMGLAAFKEIFFWEWFHRLWGRLIGVAYAVPYGVFLALRAIPRGWHLPLLGLFLLGGLQGVVGMWMVESGLVDRPAVSHYRLATHLGMAMLLYALCLAAGVRLWMQSRGTPVAAAPADRRAVLWLLPLLVPTLIYGAFVAGMDAGLAYNTWPLMEGRFFPPEALSQVPWWSNFPDNTAMVQFIHRWLAIGFAVALVVLAIRRRRAWRQAGDKGAPLARMWLGMKGLIVVQIVLGIAALLTHLDIAVATAHQGGALLILGGLSVILALSRGWSVQPHRA